MTFIVTVIESPKQQNCFGYVLPTPTSIPSSSTFGVFQCVQMSANNPSTFVIQAYGDRPPFNFITLSPIFANVSGIKHGDHLLLEPVLSLPTCISMELEPDNFEDWNIVESTACVIEEVFLDQIRAVHAGMKFVLFVAPGVPAKFRILKTVPETGRESAVLATNITEVLVAPRKQSSGIHSSRPQSSRASLINPSLVEKLTSDNPTSGYLKEFIHTGEPQEFRLLPKTFVFDDDYHDLGFGSFSFIVALSKEKSSFIKKSIISVSQKNSSYQIFTLLLEIPDNEANDAFQRLVTVLNKFPNHCIVSEGLEAEFPDCSWIKVRYLEKTEVQEVSNLDVSISIKNEEEIPAKLVRNFLMDQLIPEGEFVPVLMRPEGITLDYHVPNGSSTSLNLTVKPSTFSSTSDQCCIFWPDSFPSISQTLTIASSTSSKPHSPEKATFPKNFGLTKSNLRPFNFQNQAIDSLADTLTKLSKKSEKINLLLLGENGSGRSAFLTFLAQRLFLDECFYTSMVDCFDWKGKSLETIERRLDETLDILENRYPAILLLDNLNFLNITVDDEERKKFIDKVFTRIATRLDKARVHCIATTRSLHQLPESLLSFHGCRLFHDVQEVPAITKNEKENILKELLQDRNIEFEHEITAVLENLTLAEIVKLSERAQIYYDSGHKSFLDAVKAAIEDTPTAGRQIQKPTDEKPVSFDSIGGLWKVKQKLTEIFLWPSKYPSLYEKCGLKIGGGAILHGPSGCGKTLITRGIAYESRFNVITVKGPELLSKYIGASEQNVRDVFARARAAKPSMIVFDEFDALAPKRGHDSTGVTDRVVNQLLTELDGVESANDGVYVLAATNRIDLIDVALLRPGRFNHKILVEIPTRDEREEILEKLVDGLEIGDDVSFEALGKLTANWTGADLRGLVINASFAAADEQLESDSAVIQMKHFKEALSGKKKRSNYQGNHEVADTKVSSRVTLA